VDFGELLGNGLIKRALPGVIKQANSTRGYVVLGQYDKALVEGLHQLPLSLDVITM
jgi:hypothetical protein